MPACRVRAGRYGAAPCCARSACSGGLAVLPGCAADFAETRLTLATGAMEGGYFAVGTALAEAWRRELGLRTKPAVLSTEGLARQPAAAHRAASADLVFCQVDVAADQLARTAPGRPDRAPRAGPASTTTWCTW